MKRKIISILLVLAVFLPCVTAVKAEDFQIYMNEDFDSSVTNTLPDSIKVVGAAETYIKEYEQRNKALYISKKAGTTAYLTIPADNIEGDCVMHFDMRTENDNTNYKINMINSGTKFNIMSVDENGRMKAQNGKEFSSQKMNKWMSVDIVYRKNVSLYDIYIDGKKMLSDWRSGVLGSFDSIGMEFKLSTKDCDIYIDNLRIYSGETLKAEKDFPKGTYNPESADYNGGAEEDKIIIQYDFDTKTGGNLVPKSNMIVTSRETTADGKKNGFLHFETYGTDDAFIDIPLSPKSTQLVYEVDVRYKNVSDTVLLPSLKLAPDSTVCVIARLKTGGAIVLDNGRNVGTISQGEWHRISAAIDTLNKTFDYYIDGKLVASDVALSIQDQDNPNLLRFYATPKDSNFDLDNILVYKGTKPDSSISAPSGNDTADDNGYGMISDSWEKNEVGEGILKDTLSFHAGSGAMFYNNEKSYPAAHAFIENKVIYLPLKLSAENSGHTVSWNPEKGCAVYDGDTEIYAGSYSFTINGGEVQLENPFIEKNGTMYMPVEAAGNGKLLDKNVYSNQNGLIVIGGLNTYTDDNSKSAAMYLMNVRPSAAQIKSDYEANGKANAHPRVMATQEDFDRIKTLIQTDKPAAAMYNAILAKADAQLDEPLQYYHLPDGVRLLMISRAVLEVAFDCGMAYRITGDRKYAERVWQEIENVALKFPDWHPTHYLDTAEMAMAMAIGYDWIYDYLSKEQREVLLTAMSEKGLNTFLHSYSTKEGWTTGTSNWTFVCNGGGIALALAMADDYPDESFALIENALRSSEQAFLQYVPDGGWFEGPNYWNYSLQYICYMLSSLNSALGTDYDLEKNTGLDNTMNFILSITGANQNAFSYSDTGSPLVHKANYGVWLGHVYNQPSWVKRRADLAGKDAAADDLLFYYPEEYKNGAQVNLPLDSYFRNIEVASQRSAYNDENMLWVAYKGGLTNQSHGHFDNGGFEFDLNGVRWARELGSDDYGLPNYGAYGTKGRAEYYRERAEGHNTLVINPDEEAIEQNFNEVGRIVDFKSAPAESYGVLDLSGPYNKKAESVKRGFYVGDYRNSLTIRDEMKLNEKKNTVYWFMHTNIISESDFEINGNTAILTDASTGKKLYLECKSNVNAEIKVMDSVPLETSPNPAQGSNPGKKIAIVLTGGRNMNLTVKMCDYDLWQKGVITPISDTPISGWTVDNSKEMPQKPKLDYIRVNGADIDGYNPDTLSYTLPDMSVHDAEPEITYPESDAYTTVTEKTRTGYEITVSDRNAPVIQTKYVINVKRLPDIVENLNGFERLTVKSVKASRVPQSENPPENVLDGDTSTRFAVDGSREWIELDMGSVVDADGYAISYFAGTQRDSYYDILISEDGVNYTTLAQSVTSGKTDAYEVFEKPIKCRYFRLVGFGNSQGIWNSPTEIALIRNKK